MHRHDPTISTQIVRHVRDCLELAGVDSAPLLLRHGIDPGVVDERDQSVALADYVAFFESAATATRNPHFGLHAARVMSAHGLGPLSFLFLSAPTLRQAFQTFTEHLDAMQEATFNAFEIDGALSYFTYGIRDDAIVQRRQDTEYSLGVMCNLMRQYADRSVSPAEIHFEHERMGSQSWYEGFFDCPVYFEQPYNRLCVATDQLDRSSSALSTELFPIIAGHLKMRMTAHSGPVDTVSQVRDILMSHAPEALPSLDATARHLDCSRATLMRHLAADGHSFGQLVAERRLGFARHLLASSHRTIADIALACGYSETASFTRAFARLVGQTPSEWRQRNRTSS